MGNEPILALPEGADDFLVYYDARSKDLDACLEKGEKGGLLVNETWRVIYTDDECLQHTFNRRNEHEQDDGCGERKIHRVTKFFLLQQIAEERSSLNLIRDQCEDVRGRLSKLHVMIRELEPIDHRLDVLDTMIITVKCFCEAFVGFFWEESISDVSWHFMDLIGSEQWIVFITVSFMRILRLREVARMTASMSPPICRKYHDSIAFVTGCKRIKNSKRCNRKIRIPIVMWPCRVKEKMTLKEVDGQMVEEIETKIIAKDDTITKVPRKFQDYETSEEEAVEQPRRHDLYGFVDRPQLQQGNPMN
ncbi:hypothetical protein Tco_0320058, partial [Tanacetum coccineum]